MRNLFGLFHLQIASHPNIYVLDTPGVLASEVLDVEISSKLALTGSNLLCMCVCVHVRKLSTASVWGPLYYGSALGQKSSEPVILRASKFNDFLSCFF